jgi:hypothetical protein
MDAMPFEQDVLAEATYGTDPDTVEPLAGVFTVTPAKAADAKIAEKHTITETDFSMLTSSPSLGF